MSTDSPASPPENPLAKSRGWLIAGGILSLFVGFSAMSFPLLFSVVLVQLLAAFALASGVISLFLAIFGKHSGHRVLEGLMALIRIAAGIALLVCIQSSVLVITLIFAIFLLVEGLFLVIGAFKLRPHGGWAWTLVSGIAALVLGAMVYSRWPSDSTWVLGLFFGINLIFNGSSLLALGFAAPKAAQA
ncbi:MAG TPA: HdeD family acid-resistance protein [Chthoniobacterales bacterium]